MRRKKYALQTGELNNNDLHFKAIREKASPKIATRSQQSFFISATLCLPALPRKHPPPSPTQWAMLDNLVQNFDIKDPIRLVKDVDLFVCF